MYTTSQCNGWTYGQKFPTGMLSAGIEPFGMILHNIIHICIFVQVSEAAPAQLRTDVQEEQGQVFRVSIYIVKFQGKFK